MPTTASSIRRIGAVAAGVMLVTGAAVAVLAPPASHRAAVVSPSLVRPAPAPAGAGGGSAAAGSVARAALPGSAPSPATGLGGTVVGPLTADTPVVPDTVVRSGSVDVEVTKGHFGDAFSSAADVARQVGGFVVSTEMSTTVSPVPLGATAPPPELPVPLPGPGPSPSFVPSLPPVRSDVPSGTLVLRVPGSRFDEARRSLEHLGQLRSEQLSGEDAGGQLADLGARLTDLHASQDGLRALAAKAGSTAELLQVQAQLNAVQQQIDGVNAQLNRLHNGVALATINVRVSEPLPVASAPRSESVLQLRVAQAGRALESVVGGVLVVAAYAVPLGVLGLLGLAVAAAARRRRTTRLPVL